MAHSNQASLMSLPLEIHSQVYKHALGGNVLKPTFKPLNSNFTILRACRECYEEAKLILYWTKIFHSHECT